MCSLCLFFLLSWTQQWIPSSFNISPYNNVSFAKTKMHLCRWDNHLQCMPVVHTLYYGQECTFKIVKKNCFLELQNSTRGCLRNPFLCWTVQGAQVQSIVCRRGGKSPLCTGAKYEWYMCRCTKSIALGAR